MNTPLLPFLLFSDFANALTNPQKYLSEKEQRAKKLEALMEEGDKEGGNEGGKVNGNNKPTVSLCTFFCYC